MIKIIMLFAFLMFVFIMSIFFILVILKISSEKKRREDLKEQAEKLNFSFNPIKNIPIDKFKLLKKGYWPATFNVLKGIIDKHKITIFDYKYTSGVGQSKTTHFQTVMMVEKKVSDFSIRGKEENKIKELFGESAEVLFKNHTIKSNIEAKDNKVIFFTLYKRIKATDLEEFIKTNIQIINSLKK